MITTSTTVRVRYAETDMMGITYHANYLPWLEIGRTELLREHGLPYKQIEAGGHRLPVIEVGIKYIRPALYDEIVTIVSRMKEKPHLRIRIDYELFVAERPVATAFTLHAFIDNEGRPVRPPALFIEAMDRLFG